MPRKYSHPRETVFDLYTERDKLPWYWRTGATIAAWIALGGYILFSIAFTSPEDNLHISTGTLTTLGGILLVVGYAVSMIAAFFSRSILFTFDCVLLPLFTSSFVGVFVTALNRGLHKTFPVSTLAYVYIPLVVATLTFLTTGILAFIIYRRVRKIKETDQRRRSRVSRESQSFGGDTSSTHRLLPMEVPEDEAQRRQLLRLLLARENRSHSPDPASTYRIDLPYEGEQPYHVQNLSVPANTSRPRGRSLPPDSNGSRWNLAKLISKRGQSPSPIPTTAPLRDPRQERREEIERASLVMQSPRWDQQQQYDRPSDWGWQNSAPQQPAWTGQGMSRYA